MQFEDAFQIPAAAFVRGRSRQGDQVELDETLLSTKLEELSDEQLRQIFQAGQDVGLRLQKFKRTMQLPRVQRILGELKGLAPKNLLDIGSGRGVFMWPLLDEFDLLPVTSIDIAPQRISDLSAVRLGGLNRLDVHSASVTELPFDRDAFDVVTALEVLEHVPDYHEAISQLVRVAARFVLVSVPSKPDDNPEHLHVLTKPILQAAFDAAGCRRVRFDAVRSHLIAIASVS